MSFQLTVFQANFEQTISGFASLADYEVRVKLLAQIVRSELLNLRRGTAHTKTRSEVSGGGKKPWRQKGTGRARHGSIRSPLWVGGGIVHGPRSFASGGVNWSCKINKSARLSGLKSILKNRLEEGCVCVFPEDFNYPKTKEAAALFAEYNQKKQTNNKQHLVLYTTSDKEKLRGLLNLDGLKMMNVANLRIYRLVQARNLILTPAAKDFLENRIREKSSTQVSREEADPKLEKSV